MDGGFRFMLTDPSGEVIDAARVKGKERREKKKAQESK